MPALAEVQRDIRRVLVTGDDGDLGTFLVGGREPAKRLLIHRRQYETSLVKALLTKFPATQWLVGSPFVTEAARHYVREHPPRGPCIAEYGDSFPEFLSTSPAAEQVPYLLDFAELECRVGHVSIAVDAPAVVSETLSTAPADRLADVTLVLQSGLCYLRVSWPVDTLMKLYLTDSAPESLEFQPEETWIEICGARGEFRMNRLTSSTFKFRQTLLDGRKIGDAAEAALEAEPAFDPGAALIDLVRAGLITAFQ